MFNAQTLYENIEAERGRRGWTMQEISDKLGVSSQIGELNLVFTSLPPSSELNGEPGREIAPPPAPQDEA